MLLPARALQESIAGRSASSREKRAAAMGACARRGAVLPPEALLWVLTLLALPRVRGDCSTLPTFQNAHPEGNYGAKKSFVNGTIISYRCDTGYVKIPEKSDSVVCQDTEWSQIPQFCDRSCNAPERFLTMKLNATFVNKNYFPINSTVIFVCREGHTPSKFGQLISTCQENGAWSPVSGSCKKKSCPNPESLDNGQVKIITDILLGSEIEYFCDEGYTLIGDNIRLCQVAGNKVVWTGDVPVCKVNTCPPPPDIQNGKHNRAGEDYFPYHETVTYHCDSSVRDRFSLIGSNTIFCEKDGQWNTAPPQCKEVRCETPQVDNAVPISGFRRSYSYRDTIIFECKEGYTLLSNNKITCEADNNWSPALPVCYKEIPPTKEPPASSHPGTAITSKTEPPVSSQPGLSLPPETKSQRPGSGIIVLIVVIIVIVFVIIIIIMYRQNNREKGKNATISVDYKTSLKQENHSEESRCMVSEN
ncbi:membrane cofactor protein isoform X2 [Sminthopsis crassicaudata]|uniref:membrane cofactor protein isoform X2 n=1 Tax=Sminthopsis crassicaudata TaxID=9301 RepID=UPI003D69153A